MTWRYQWPCLQGTRGERPTGSQKNLGHSDCSRQLREFEHVLGANIMPGTLHVYFLAPQPRSTIEAEGKKVKMFIAQSDWAHQGLRDGSPPGSSVHGISQARRLEWVAISSSRGSSPPKDQTHILCLASRFFITEPLGKST